MSRKTYVSFAAMLAAQQPDVKDYKYKGGQANQWLRIVKGTANLFANDNMNFDYKGYLFACGYDEGEK